MNKHHSLSSSIFVKLNLALCGPVFEHVSKYQKHSSLNRCRNITWRLPCWLVTPSIAVVKGCLGVKRDQLVPVIFFKLYLLLKQVEADNLQNIYRHTLKGRVTPPSPIMSQKRKYP
ncbi:hypothetical protein LECLMA074M_17860 [Leclercia sp. M-A074-M]